VYVLGGRLSIEIAGQAEELSEHDFVLVEAGAPHALANRGRDPVRWYEVGAPLCPEDRPEAAFPGRVWKPEPGAATYRRGRFDAGDLPPPSETIGLAGFGAAHVGGARLKMLVDRELGASQFNLFILEYVPGGLIRPHDHPFEESFFFLAGEIEADLGGTVQELRAGDYCWSGPASVHAFTIRSGAPTRWLETQAPQPPSRYQARFRSDWE
jgi:quercetin dioxygenase-like cupin family protein